MGTFFAWIQVEPSKVGRSLIEIELNGIVLDYPIGIDEGAYVKVCLQSGIIG